MYKRGKVPHVHDHEPSAQPSGFFDPFTWDSTGINRHHTVVGTAQCLRKIPVPLAWDSECAFGVLVYGFLGFEYLFYLKTLIRLFCLVLCESSCLSEAKLWL